MRKAVKRDIAEILDLVEAVHIKNLKNLDGGFLMIPNASSALFQLWLVSSRYCYVAKKNGSVVGVLIALPGGGTTLDGEGWRRVEEIAGGAEYLAVVQIASGFGQRKQGVGRMMLERLFAEAGETVIYSSSMKKPYNESSERFHKKMGFDYLETLPVSDGTEAIIWRWKPKAIEYRTSSDVIGRKE